MVMHRGPTSNREYFVHWYGYHPSEYTDEQRENIPRISSPGIDIDKNSEKVNMNAISAVGKNVKNR